MTDNKRPKFPHLKYLKTLFKDDLIVIRDSLEGFDREIRFEDLAKQICGYCRGGTIADAGGIAFGESPISPDCLEMASIPWPSGLTPDINIDARLFDTLTLNGSLGVERWEDQLIGSLFYSDQTTPANCPLYVQDGINGCPAIEFNTNKYLDFGVTDTSSDMTLRFQGMGFLPLGTGLHSSAPDPCPDFGGGTGITILAVVQQTYDPTGIASQNLIWWHPNAAVAAWISLRTNDTMRLNPLAARIRSGTPSNIVADAGSIWTVGYEGVVGMTAYHNDASSANRLLKAWKDGENVGQVANVSGGQGSYLIGASPLGVPPAVQCNLDTGFNIGRIGAGSGPTTVSEFFLGRIGQICIWNSALSEASVATAMTHMRNTWRLG